MDPALQAVPLQSSRFGVPIRISACIAASTLDNTGGGLGINLANLTNLIAEVYQEGAGSTSYANSSDVSCNHSENRPSEFCSRFYAKLQGGLLPSSLAHNDSRIPRT